MRTAAAAGCGANVSKHMHCPHTEHARPSQLLWNQVLLCAHQVAILLVCAVLLLLASCVRISSLYLPFLSHDHFWYPLCSLPELLTLLLLLCRPGLVVHIGTAGKSLLPALIKVQQSPLYFSPASIVRFPLWPILTLLELLMLLLLNCRLALFAHIDTAGKSLLLASAQILGGEFPVKTSPQNY